MTAPRHVCLIDASGFVWRAHYGRQKMVDPEGLQVGAVVGFCKMLRELISRTDADHIGVVFDVSRQTFRRELYPEYKANRPATPDEIVSQFKLVRECVDALGLVRVESEGYEADDLIASYAAEAIWKAGAVVTIVSPDKDLLQLVDDEHGCQVFNPMHNRMIHEAGVLEKFGVGPTLVCDVLALVGDATDNVPGVKGIGIKTATALIQKYGDLESLLANTRTVQPARHAESLHREAGAARMSKRLVTLKRDVPLPVPLSAFYFDKVEPAIIDGFLERLSATPFGPILAEKPERVDPMTAPLPSFSRGS